MISIASFLPKGLNKFVSSGWFRVDLASRDSSGRSERCTKKEYCDCVHHLGVMLKSSSHLAPSLSRSVLKIDTNSMTAVPSEANGSRHPGALIPSGYGGRNADAPGDCLVSM